MKTLLRVLLLAAACLVLVTAGMTQDTTKPRSAQAGGFPDLVAGLKATPGCLGVETARTSSGKNVIFAWFENKEAVRRWYYSETHLKAMQMGFPGHKPAEPMKDVPDSVGPIMAIASLTPSDKPAAPGMAMPVSQISIELYTPVTGGLFVGSRFAPEALKVPGMHDYTPK
jgi:hypothetical protein